MKKNKIYVTTMYRWGNKENHSYVSYVGFNKEQAIKDGENEFYRRGGKYSFEVIESMPDNNMTIKQIESYEMEVRWTPSHLNK